MIELFENVSTALCSATAETEESALTSAAEIAVIVKVDISANTNIRDNNFFAIIKLLSF